VLDSLSGNTVAVAELSQRALFVSTDGGANWENQGIHRSADGGKTWEMVSDTSLLYLISMTADAGHLYITTRSGIIRSGDQGPTWTRYNEGLPGNNVTELGIKGDSLFAIGSSTIGGFGILKRSAWPAGISEHLSRDQTLLIHPNPASDQIFINANPGVRPGMPYSIFNINGNVVKTGITDHDSKIAVADLSPGLFLIVI
jgi:hypothetical protein